MRRGGVLILLIGLILIVGAIAIFFLLPQGGGSLLDGGAAQPTVALATEIPQVDVVRARVDIPANSVISDTVTLLEVITIPQTEFDPEQNFSSVIEVEGQLTTRAFRANEIIEKDALTEPGLSQQLPTQEPNRARDKAYPLVVNNLSGVADQITPGDFVDVVATFSVTRRVSIPTGTRLEDQAGAQVPVLERENLDQELRSTKTIVQRAQVLRILRPSAAPEGTPVEGEAPPPAQVDESGQPIDPAAGDATGGAGTITQGSWTLILALNNQEIEIVEFAIAAEARTTLVLRGAGDTAFEPTIGITLDLLVAEFGLPLPRPVPPRVVGPEEVFTPEPTRTPAPTRVP